MHDSESDQAMNHALGFLLTSLAACGMGMGVSDAPIDDPTMTARDRIQLACELAFFPPRLNGLWSRIRGGGVPTSDEAKALDDAALLHLALPDDYSSQRALERLALFQAKSRAYGMPRFIRNIRRHLGLPELPDTAVPARLVRDIALPSWTRVGGAPDSCQV